jgi:hypothetical protein
MLGERQPTGSAHGVLVSVAKIQELRTEGLMPRDISKRCRESTKTTVIQGLESVSAALFVTFRLPRLRANVGMQTIEVVISQPQCLQLTRIPRRPSVRKIRQHVAQIPEKIPPDAGARV